MACPTEPGAGYGCPHCRDQDPRDAEARERGRRFTFAVVCSFCLGSHECFCDDCLAGRLP